MPLSKELQDAYALSAMPYIATPGPTPESALSQRSWRYVLEINSACNLKCALCHAGNRGGFEYTPGIMNMDLLEQILDKIQRENPNAVVCSYVNSEPFLHPQLATCLQSIKRRGLKLELSSNLNIMRDIDAVLAARPDLFTVSVSGFTQPVYERAHRGGNIEVVKENLKLLCEANKKLNPPVFIGVSYHMYEYNLGDEMMKMKEFTESLGFLFMISWARTISMENTVQACREIERQKGGNPPPFEVKNGVDLNELLPPAKPEFMEAMKQLRFPPDRAAKLYAKYPVAPVCIIADVFTEIRHDGRVQLCAWTDDMRFTIGNYLDMTQEQISEARRGHPICSECLRYRLNLYFHILDAQKWDSGGE